MTRVIGAPRSRRRRWTLMWCLVVALSAGMVFISGAQAVHSLNLFELDANTLDAAAVGGVNPDDWANLYNSGGSPSSHLPTCTKLAPNSCFEAFALDADKIGKAGDTSYFTGGGSKDRNDLSQWLWGTNDQSPDKNDITNAFAAAYHKSNGKLVLYFGSDRFAVNGDAQMGFWFNQNPICLAGGVPAGTDPNCPASTPNQASHAGQFVDPTTGDVAHHTDGDLLVLINYNNGGAIGTAGVYTWQGGASGAPVQSLFGTDQADCVSLSNPNDDFCATVNKVSLDSEPPWPYAGKGKSVGTYPASAFLEGGINLEDVQSAGTCFPSFMAETRSSSGPGSGLSLDATLKDFALHSFQRCSATFSTQPKNDAGDAAPPSTIGTGGSAIVRDQATLDVSGASTWTGTLKFFLCKVAADATPSNTCDGTTNVGVQVGTTRNISNADNTSTYLSDHAEVTAAGRYCWRGEFASNTNGVPSRTDGSAGECFIIGPVTPTLSTTAVDAAGNPIKDPTTGVETVVDFGSAIYDKAAINGTANKPLSGTGINVGPTIPATGRTAATGTITFKLYGPSATAVPSTTDCNTLAKDSTGTDFPSAGLTASVTSGDGTYPSANPSTITFTPGSPGYYYWKASYGGDTPNTTGAPLDNTGAIIQHNADCSVASERVQIRRIPTELRSAQSWIPNDSAEIKSTVSGDNIQAGGSVAFTLYSNATCTPGAGNVNVKYTENHTLVAGDITSGVATVSTTNAGGATGYTITTLKNDAADTAVNYSWKVVYTPGSTDAAHLGRQSACTPAGAGNVPPASIEKFTITYTNDNSGGTALP